MFRTKLLIALLTITLAGLPAAGQTTPNTPLPPPVTGRRPPLKRMKLNVEVLSHIGKAARAKLRSGWLLSVRQQVMVNWHPLLPQITQPPMQQPGTTVLVATMGQSGVVGPVRVERSSGVRSLDRAAEGAIKAASPLPQLPAGVKPQALQLKFRFIYD